MGGKERFISQLQSVFDRGNYDPTNEPNIAYPYLFSYFKGEEWRTQVLTHKLLKAYFKNNPEGLPGNDDTGTMSAWAIFILIARESQLTPSLHLYLTRLRCILIPNNGEKTSSLLRLSEAIPMPFALKRWKLMASLGTTIASVTVTW